MGAVVEGAADAGEQGGLGEGFFQQVDLMGEGAVGVQDRLGVAGHYDEHNIALVQAVLRRRPQIELHVAMNGRDGVQAATDKQPGLIRLDNRLPDTTGSRILQELASSAATAAIPVVILTGDSEEVIEELLASGAAESVAKPFSFHQFIEIIDRYLT
jgi:CheY-like chemotaxis protein